MIGLISVRLAALAALTAGIGFAADVSGKWTAQMGGPGGQDRSITFNFKQDGATLSGTVDGPDGQTLDIKDGRVDGESISFKINRCPSRTA